MRRLAPVGTAAVLFGFVTLLDRGVAGLFQLNYLVVSAVGALAIAVGARYANVARKTPSVDPPEPRHRSGVLGVAVGTALGTGGRIGEARRAELRRRIQDVAVDALVTSGGRDRAAAARAVEAGSWTGDAVAAGYLAEPQSLPRLWRVRGLVRPRATTRACVERSLDAIEEVGAT